MNKILKEARDFKDIGIWIQAIPPSKLRVAVTGDAAWGNARDDETDMDLCSQGGLIVRFCEEKLFDGERARVTFCLLYTSPSPRDS